MDWETLEGIILLVILTLAISIPLFVWIVKMLTRRVVGLARVPAAIRDELDQTFAWWDREFDKLNRAAFPPRPFDPAEHEGHNVVAVMTYGGRVVRRSCADCDGGSW